MTEERPLTTEAEWLACDDPRRMMDFIKDRTSERKLRWFAIACCRRLDTFLKAEEIRRVLQAAERYADGLIADSTAGTWYRRAWKTYAKLRRSTRFATERMACHAVRSTVMPNRYQTSPYVYREVVNALVDGTGELRTSPSHWAAARRAEQELVPLLRDVVGNPFRPVAIDPVWLAWHGGTVARLAQAIYDERAFERLPILADALEEAGCTDADILNHCRQPGEHVRGCWVVDALLGKK